VASFQTVEQFLVDSGKIPEDSWKLIKAQNRQDRGSLWRRAVALGYLSESEVLKLISEKFKIKFLEPEQFPKSIVSADDLTIPYSFLSDNKIYPVSLQDDCFEAVIADPASIPLLEAIFMGEDIDLKISLSTEDTIHNAIEKDFGKGASVMESIVDKADGESDDEIEDIDNLDDLVSGVPIIKLVNLIISRAVEVSASDIHLEPFEKELIVRYRIDGILHPMEAPPKKMQDAIIARVKIMAKLDIAEKRLPQDGRIRTKTSGKDIDMRVSTIPTVYGESVVMRILDRSNALLNLTDLGFPHKELAEFEKIISMPYGMFLVTGPTGSGKTTTLYSALNTINSPSRKIITIEDPVEYQMKGINQIQVHPKIGLTFQDGLRSIVRQDPDTIMVGEIRDTETAEIAVQAALTGHMVFSTVHTNDSAGAITRLLDMGIEHYLISSALVGSLAQRLVRILCNECKEKFSPDAESSQMILDAGGGMEVYKEQGCPSCAGTGFRGRVGIYELLINDDSIRAMILSKESSHIIKEKARKAGMKTLREDGWLKVGQGITTISEVVRVTTEEVV